MDICDSRVAFVTEKIMKISRIKLYDDNSVGWLNLTWNQYLAEFKFIWLGDHW